MNSLYCPQCGEETEEFQEGYCVDCCENNQRSLDMHNIEFDMWEVRTENDRQKKINESIRLANP